MSFKSAAPKAHEAENFIKDSEINMSTDKMKNSTAEAFIDLDPPQARKI